MVDLDEEREEQSITCDVTSVVEVKVVVVGRFLKISLSSSVLVLVTTMSL